MNFYTGNIPQVGTLLVCSKLSLSVYFGFLFMHPDIYDSSLAGSLFNPCTSPFKNVLSLLSVQLCYTMALYFALISVFLILIFL